MTLLSELLQQHVSAAAVAAGILVYCALVGILRERRAKSLPARFRMTSRQDFKNMTADESQAILKDLTELEFPKLMGFSIVFALFKV